MGDLIERHVNASFSLANPVIGENGFTPDCAPMEYGTNGAADFRVSALSIRNANGDTTTDIRYVGHKIYKGKPSLSPLPYVYTNNDDEADTLDEAIDGAYEGVAKISFKDMHFRHDIGRTLG